MYGLYVYELSPNHLPVEVDDNVLQWCLYMLLHITILHTKMNEKTMYSVRLYFVQAIVAVEL